MKKKPKKNTHVLTPQEKERIRAYAYLGKKGYTILKEQLSSEEQTHLYEELKVSPEVHGISYGAPQEQVQFPVYRENDKKMYISGIHLKVIIRSYLILKDLLKKDTMGKFRSEMLMMRMI